jgi:molybdopterin-guanine dinucleotide biosynthesis protein A
VVTGLHNRELGIENIDRVRVVLDAFPGRGPLVGIFTGLLNSRSENNLAVACDMPFLNSGLLRHMTEISHGWDAVVPRLGSDIEPLHAIYSNRCLPEVRKLLDEGTYSVSELLKRIKVRYVDAPEIDIFDPQHLSFFNINTEEDLKRARDIINRSEQSGSRGSRATDVATQA